MLSAEEQFFLTVLADHLNGRPTAPVPGLDWKSLYDMAEQHQFSALFYAQCGAFMPPEAELLFLRDYGAAVADYAARQKIAAEIDRAFTRHRIPYVPLTGLVVAESYPQPELRTMGDIDILVRMEDKERAHTVLLENGFRNMQQGDFEWVYTAGKVEIELHHHPLYDGPACIPAASALAGRIWEYVRLVPGSSRCEPDGSFHFLFLVMHLSKHWLFYGAGFRQFMDLTVAVQKWRLDWRQLNDWFTETGLLRFVRISLTLCRQWFRLELPFDADDLSPEFTDEMTRQIFRNGVFGHDDEKNAENDLISVLEWHNGDSLHSRLQICRQWVSPTSPELKKFSVFQLPRILFPGYGYMRKLDSCRFVDGRPWLLPAGWVWRLMIGGHAKFRQIIPVLLFSRKKVLERRAKLKKLGL